MKQLICEMCGSNDLLKQDGVFVCQSCGVKYSVEEAKSMMVEIEGAVVVKGTVELDTSKELDNLYQLARRAKDTENNENASKYYDMILMKDPSSWEANFYSVYYKTMSCKIAEISIAATNVSNCIKDTFLLIRDHIKDTNERKNAIIEIRDQANKVSKMLFDAATSHMRSIDPLVKQNFQMQYLANSIAAGGIPKYVCDNLCDIFADDEDIMRTVGIQILKDRISEGIVINAADQYVRVIKRYDPDYQVPANQTIDDFKKTVDSTTASSGGCYVATCVYGSYDCPQVWTLRRYRDDTLASTWYGRAFIRMYYAISPTIVKLFGKTNWFKNMWKNKLDKMVLNLRRNGVDDTPYQDKNWR